MRIIIKTTKIELTKSLQDFIEEKVGSLEKFLEDILKKEDKLDGYQERARAFVEVGKSSLCHRKGNVFYAECQITLPGKSIRAIAKREDLRLAICEVKDELQRQLKEYKDSITQQFKRSQRRVKKRF